MSGVINIGPREDKKPTLRELEDALLESMEALRRGDTGNPVFKRLRDLTDN